jgi:hypothetical protein
VPPTKAEKDAAAKAAAEQQEPTTAAVDRTKTTVRLSNPLRKEDALRLGLEERVYETNEPVTLSKDNARSLISAGYAQVDPEDSAAVAKVVGPDVTPDGVQGAGVDVEPAAGGAAGPNDGSGTSGSDLGTGTAAGDATGTGTAGSATP